MTKPTTFFKLDREIFNHWISGGEPYDRFHAWVWLIGHANYADSKHLYNGRIQEVKRGELVTSEMKLASEWGWSRGKVRRFLTLLEDDGMVTLKRTTDSTSITVENYAFFQSPRTTNGTTNGQVTVQRTDSPRTHNKKNKEEYKNNTQGECESYLSELANTLGIELNEGGINDNGTN